MTDTGLQYPPPQAGPWPPPEPDPLPCPGGCGELYRWTWRDGPRDGHPFYRGRWFAPLEAGGRRIASTDVQLCGDCRNAGDKPDPWPPLSPPARVCADPDCVVQLPHTWRDGPWYGIESRRGRWVPASTMMCEEHEAEAEELRKLGERLDRRASAGLPPTLLGYDFAKFHPLTDAGGSPVPRRAADEVTIDQFADFRERVKSDGVIGITPWNRALARRLRDMTVKGGRVQSLIVAGPVATGKTTLLAAAVGALADRGRDVRYIAERQLLETIRSEFKDPRSKSRGVVWQLSRVGVLALDDLGVVEHPRPWYLDAIEAIVAARYDHGLPVWITTNQSFDELEALYGERVRSRLAEMVDRKVVALDGPEWREVALRPGTSELDDDPTPDGLPLVCGGCGYTPCRGGTECRTHYTETDR